MEWAWHPIKVEPEDGAGLERLARYIMRRPVSLEWMSWSQGAAEVGYTLKPKDGRPAGQESLDPLECVARVLAHVPEYHLPGDTVTHAIRVGNDGPLPVTNAHVVDTFPSDLVGASWTCAGSSGGSCNSDGVGDIDEMVDLPVGALVTFTVTGAVDQAATRDLVNQAAVSSSLTDPDLTDNTSTHVDALEVPLFCDGFDSGNTDDWSVSSG